MKSNYSRPALLASAALLALAAPLTSARAQASGDYIGTWTASPQPVWDADFPIPTGLPRTLWNQTLRQIAHISLGGKKVRIVLSNEYGTRPLTIGAAHIALAGAGSAITAGSDHALTFGGASSVTIPPGAPAISDPIDFSVPALSNLAVSLFVQGANAADTMHWDGGQTAYIGAGDQTAAAEVKADATNKSRIYLKEIQVDAPADAQAIVLFGDSITDGFGSTPDTNQRWPDILAARLIKSGAAVSVLNEGISGAKILSDRMGTNALARFDRDVLGHARARTVVLMMGINDFGWPASALAPGDTVPSAEAVIAGYHQLIVRAHEHNLRIVGATLTPFKDTFKGHPFEGYYTVDKDNRRQAVNKWIRSSGEFDGVIDFDALTKDPADPLHIQPALDVGDHLHPNDAGYKLMGEAVETGVLLGKK